MKQKEEIYIEGILFVPNEQRDKLSPEEIVCIGSALFSMTEEEERSATPWQTAARLDSVRSSKA